MILHIAVWWFLTVLLGVATFPLVSRVCHSLPDKGYSAAKASGIVIATYFIWLLPSLKLMPFGAVAISISLAIVLLLSLLAGKWGSSPADRDFPIRQAVTSEIVFTVSFCFFVWMLWQRPDIYSGQLEDWANSAFIHSINRSAYFPPEDPWFAGSALPYYYGGHLIVAWMGRLAQVAPEVSFNLASAMFFGLTITLAYGLGFNLTKRIIWGAGAAVMVGFMGYITGVFQLAAWVFHADVFGFPPGAAASLTDWLASFDWGRTIRIIPNTVTFYPYYILSNADVHPMATSIPFQLLALELGLASVISGPVRDTIAGSVMRYLLLALAFGFLILVNPWTFPVFFGFLFLAFLLFRLGVRKALAAGALAVFCYLPFLLSGAVMGFRGVGLVNDRTPLYGYAGIFGVFWVVIFCLLFSFKERRKPRVLASIAAALVGGATAWLWNVQILILLLPAFAAVALILTGKQVEALDRFAVLLAGAGIVLAVGADLFYLRDAYGPPFERYNTIMKLYLMQWVFLGLASAYAMFRLNQLLKGKIKIAVLSVAGVLLAASLVHPIASTTGWTSGMASSLGPGGGTLDGVAYLKTTNEGDYEAIKWLNENVAGNPVILEAPAETAIGVYNARVASLTGLPDILGWGPWEVQWGRDWDRVFERNRDAATAYNATNAEEALEVAGKYDIQYVYIGKLERDAYASAGLDKFDAATDYFEKVYDSGGVEIFRVIGVPTARGALGETKR